MSRYLNVSRDIISIINKYLLPSKNLNLKEYLNGCLIPFISSIKYRLNNNLIFNDNIENYLYCKSFENVKYTYIKNYGYWTLRVKN